MKNINQFDYPSKEAQSYKSNSQHNMQDLSESAQNKKTRYKENLQYHMQLERNKTKQAQKIKRQQESKRKKYQLEFELEKKKKELQNLEVLKQQAQQFQKKSYQLAVLKQEQDRIQKQEDQKRKIQFDENALVRFQEAMKKLNQQKQSLAFKQKLAEQRRKTSQDYQKLQRIKVEKYRALLQQKQKNNAQDNSKEVQEYQKTFKQSMSHPNPNYNRTCIHHLRIIPETKFEQQNAFQRGNIQEDDLNQRIVQKKRRNQQHERKSKQRGRNAFFQIQREKQYRNFEKQAEQEQIKYNLERIQAGKRNQFIGIKPATLSQMQMNKKIRSEEEFGKMFYSNLKSQSQNLNRSATKYEIVQRKIPQNQKEGAKANKQNVSKKKLVSYFKQKSESDIPAVSEGKHSFEQPQYSQFKNHSRSHSNIQQQMQQNEQQNEIYQNQTSHIKNSLKQTRIPQDYKKVQKNKLQKQKRCNNEQSIKQDISYKKVGKSTQTKKYQSEQFNTNQMLEKYGLNKKPKKQIFKNHYKQSEQKQKKPQSKRKVVELGNICQNRKVQKQQLSYSSQSEQDSLM